MAEQIHVRSACEPCHERKIRCIVASGGGPCERCQSRKLKCYFLPRYKSGRPRENNTRPRESNSRPSSSSVQSSRAPSRSGYAASRQMTPALLDDGNPIAFPANSASTEGGVTCWTWNDLPMQQQSPNLPMSSHEPCGPLSASSLSLNANVRGPLFPDMLHGEYEALTSPNPPRATTASLSESAMWSSSSQSSLEQDSGESQFAALLQHCMRIQRHVTAVQSMPTHTLRIYPRGSDGSSFDISVLLEDIETACNHIFSVFGRNGPAKITAGAGTEAEALMSLVNATTVKVLQLYELLLDHDILAAHGLDMLHYKRLDLCNMQLQIVIARIQQLRSEGTHVETCIAMTASMIEEKLKRSRR